MEKAVASGFAKTLWQNMKHQQVKGIFAGHRSCPIFLTFGMDISESDLAVFAAKDVLFLNDFFIQILPKLNKKLITMRYFFFDTKRL
jgi:hypothetical protein